MEVAMKKSIIVFLLFLLLSNGFSQKEIEITLINKTGFDFISRLPIKTSGGRISMRVCSITANPKPSS
jgi:hypothetical protein